MNVFLYQNQPLKIEGGGFYVKYLHACINSLLKLLPDEIEVNIKPMLRKKILKINEINK